MFFLKVYASKVALLAGSPVKRPIVKIESISCSLSYELKASASVLFSFQGLLNAAGFMSSN
jgi:hypothetical protein